jgi:hypothetical protein
VVSLTRSQLIHVMQHTLVDYANFQSATMFLEEVFLFALEMGNVQHQTIACAIQDGSANCANTLCVSDFQVSIPMFVQQTEPVLVLITVFVSVGILVLLAKSRHSVSVFCAQIQVFVLDMVCAQVQIIVFANLGIQVHRVNSLFVMVSLVHSHQSVPETVHALHQTHAHAMPDTPVQTAPIQFALAFQEQIQMLALEMVHA